MERQPKNTQSTLLINKWGTESTHSLDYQTTSLVSFTKNIKKPYKKVLSKSKPQPKVSVFIVEPPSPPPPEKFEKESEVKPAQNKRRCPIWLTIALAIIAALCLIALIVTVCVLLLVPKELTTTTTAVATATITTTITFPISNTTVGVPPSFRWNSTGITVAGTVSMPGIVADRLNVAFTLVLDSSDTMYIADTNNNRVQKWLSGALSGTTVAGQAIGTTGANSSYLQNPSSLAVDSSGNVYVTDNYNHRIQFWSSGATTGMTIAGTGIAGSSNNQLSFPYGIAFDSSTGTIYISDQTNHRIMRYFSGATTGTVVAGGNGAGTNNNQLSSPAGIYYDASTYSLIIANFGANNIVRWPIGATNWILVAGSITGTGGNTETLLDRPFNVVLDPWGNIYVADTYNQRIQFFLSGQSNGTTIAGVTDTLGVTSNLFRYPYSLALDSQYNLYVSDSYNFRIQKFIRY